MIRSRVRTSARAIARISLPSHQLVFTIYDWRPALPGSRVGSQAEDGPEHLPDGLAHKRPYHPTEGAYRKDAHREDASAVQIAICILSLSSR